MNFEPDMLNTTRSITDADIPQEVRTRQKELLDAKYASIVSKTATDISRTNLIELGIPTDGPIIASKPYKVPLKYTEFVDKEIKQLEEAGIIPRSMSNWTSPILVVPKNEECIGSNTSTSTNTNNNCNLRLCSDYRKLNSQVVTACHINADGSLDKVISNYPLPTIDNLLPHFNGCKFFSTIDLRSGYYHI